MKNSLTKKNLTVDKKATILLNQLIALVKLRSLFISRLTK